MRTAMVMLALVGCGGTAAYGSFIEGRTEVQAAIARDAALLLGVEYEPTEHAIRFGDDAQDAFGRSFAAELRKVGFAVKDGTASKAQGDLALRYVVDKLKGTDLVRVTLYVQRQSLSRAYAQRSDGVFAVGPWALGNYSGGR